MTTGLIGNLPSVGPTIIVPATKHNWLDFFRVNKFGRNPDVDTGAQEDIVSYGGTKTYLSVADTLYISSSNAGDTVDIVASGLDADGNRQEVTQALNGQTKTEIGSGVTWLDVFRGWNANSTDLAGDVYIYADDTVTGGVPDTASKVLAKIDQTKQQTHIAAYIIPSGYTGYLLGWYASMNRSNTTGASDVELFSREDGKVFRSKDIRGLAGSGNSSFIHYYPIAPSYSELTTLKVSANVSANDTDISAGFSLLCVKNKT